MGLGTNVPAVRIALAEKMAENCGGRSGARSPDLLGVNDKRPRQSAILETANGGISPFSARFVRFPCRSMVHSVPMLEDDPVADLREASKALEFGPYQPRPSRPIKAPPGHLVYFVGGKEGPVKIGFTQQPIKERLKCIQNGSPVKLFVLATQAAPRAKERLYHKQFAAFRLHGEWFERAPEIQAVIERLNAKVVPSGTAEPIGRML